MKKNLKISVIICCYNSEKNIIRTLEHLARQDFSGDWEVILVDNNCTDGTVALSKSAWSELSTDVTLKIVQEKRPGLSFAREQGIANSNSPLLVFCDDDNWLAPDYLTVAVTYMNQNPSVGIAGGFNEAVIECAMPRHEKFSWEWYAVGQQGEKTGDITTSKGYVFG
ncbi:MAG TPA: hypothetical protein DGG95_16525, partial [Cytophagales bacterium]|nr:hypothetical protein [Cytophagales bacterium]